LKRLLLPFFALLGLRALVSAQTYSFKTQNASDRYEIQTDNNGLYCLFRISEKKALSTVFREVFLNSDLTATDSTDYSIDGQANLVASGADEKYLFHAFYTKIAPIEKIVFVITDKFGKVQFTFSKTAVDFSRHFPKPVKKLKNIQLSFVPNNGTPGMLLIQPFIVQGSVQYRGQLFSLRAEDGDELWASTAPFLSNIQSTDSLLIGLTSSFSNGRYQYPAYQINFVDKNSGRLLKAIPFTSKDQSYRTISVFASNGKELMIAGSEFESGNLKNGRFFMSMFSLYGEKIFEKVDSAARLSTRRLHLMGNVFNQDGNLVLVGEGWKPDATRAVVYSAASILLAVTVGGYAGVSTRVDHKIDNVVFATLSPVDGKLINFKTFPVGPWYDYGNLMTEGGHVLISISNQVIIYDANDPDTPPKPFTKLGSRENLILTPSGPIINKWEKGRYVLSKLR
jgi:hypothetical protein